MIGEASDAKSQAQRSPKQWPLPVDLTPRNPRARHLCTLDGERPRYFGWGDLDRAPASLAHMRRELNAESLLLYSCRGWREREGCRFQSSRRRQSARAIFTMRYKRQECALGAVSFAAIWLAASGFRVAVLMAASFVIFASWVVVQGDVAPSPPRPRSGSIASGALRRPGRRAPSALSRTRSLSCEAKSSPQPSTPVIARH